MTIVTIKAVLRAAGHCCTESKAGPTGERDNTSSHRWWFESSGSALNPKATAELLERGLHTTADLDELRGGWELRAKPYTILVYTWHGNPNWDVEATTVFVEKG